MCGICGFVGAGTQDDLAAMTAALVHRGPDGEGRYVDEQAAVFIGHRRLAIVDIEGGLQPMWNEDGQVAVVFNGEIYNHADLRAELVARGHRFATDHSDTEVLVHGWEEWREELPRRLNGMFAFAILDRRRKCIFLARDRFGEKPLYYCARPGFFAFASELGSLACHSKVPRSISAAGLQKYFAYGYLPAPHTLIEGSAKLPGGHWLRLDIGAPGVTVRAYWQFTLEPDESLADGDEPRLVEECSALLERAARRRLMSDVPLGVFLSGGLDSGSILALLAKSLPPDTLSTFTIGFDEPSFDESEPARVVARHIGSVHHERRFGVAAARDVADSVLARLDEPIADASLLPTYLLSRFAREKVTVVLSGDGGDELFAGYDPFLALAPAAIYQRMMPRAGHRALRRLSELLPISHGNMGMDFKIRRSLMGLSHRASLWLPVWMAPLDPKDAVEAFERPMLLEEVYAEAIGLWERDPKQSSLDRALEFFTRFYLQDDILAKVDRAAMMCSLETRAVFLDNDVVEFCRRLPGRFKLRGGERKYLLKKVARRLLPESIVGRRKKGFGIPLAKWLREWEPEPAMKPLRGMDATYGGRAFAAHRAGVRDHRLLLWAWIAAQETAEQFGRYAASPAETGIVPTAPSVSPAGAA